MLRDLLSRVGRVLRRQSKRQYAETLALQLLRLREGEMAARAEHERWMRAPFADQAQRARNLQAARSARAAEESFAARALRKARTLARAKQAAGLGLALGVFLHGGCAGSGLGTDALEASAVAVSMAVRRCEAMLEPTKGDTSEAARADRRECLGLPSFDSAADAAEALADEVESARFFIETGDSRTLHR